MSDPLERLAAALADRYRLERELGAGGMATVYLADDLKHNRKVAVKVLRPELAAVLGAERFLSEIQTTANLQHQNILPLFDSGETDGFLYYVMPFVDGETLRDKLNRETQLGVEEAVSITTEVAGALDYAHRHDVIHRDVKPENILLHDGRPVVADFGIALAVSAASGTRKTETGMSLGTPHYMSPEQATAEKDLTNRSDIYSLGSVLYEMLSGSPPHLGASAQQIIMKIVTEDARPVTELRKSVPLNVSAAIGKSLEKLPADRFATANEFAAALADRHFVGSVSTRAKAAPATSHLTYVFGILLVAVTVLAAWGWVRPAPSVRSGIGIRHLNVVLPDSAPLAIGTGRPALELSADGSKLVYVTRSSGVSHIMIRDLQTGASTLVPGSERASGPFISAGGRVGFVARSGMLNTDLDAAPARLMGRLAPVTRGAAWVDDTTVVYVGSPNSGVTRRSLERLARGGSPDDEPSRVTPDSARDVGHAWPTVAASGAILYTIAEQADPSGWEIAGVPPGGTEQRVLVQGASRPKYVPSGYLVFLRRGALWAVALDPHRLETLGEARMVVSGILTEAGGLAHFAIADDGTLAYVSGADWRGTRRFVWVNREDQLDTLPVPPAPYTDLALSPDGRNVATTQPEGSNFDVWIGDLTMGTLTRKTDDPGEDGSPVWSPDGRRLALATEQLGSSPHLALVSLNADDLTMAIEPRDDGGWYLTPPTGWSEDGNFVFVTFRDVVRGGSNSTDIYTFDIASSSLEPWLESEHELRGARPSPNGRWVAFVSDESGTNQVYVSPVNTPAEAIIASLATGEEPRWGRTTGALYFRAGDQIMSVGVSEGTNGSPELTMPELAFQLPSSLYLDGSFNSASWDLSADEQRVLGLEEVQASTVTSINVIVNWFDELEAIMGSGDAR